jgi:hypothetical protein
VAAPGAVLVAFVVASAAMLGRAPPWVRIADRDRMLIDVIAVWVVQVPLVQVVDMVVVDDGGVPASRPVRVVVFFMHPVRFYRSPLPVGGLGQPTTTGATNGP